MISSHLVFRYFGIPAIYCEVALSFLQILQVYRFDLPHILSVYMMAIFQVGSTGPEEAF